MKELNKNDLVHAIVHASIPCIKSFFDNHKGEHFYGFAIETLAEQGYIHLCANSIEAYKPTYDQYIKQGFSEEIIEGEKWNNQEWEYFDFNCDCQIWEENWSVTENLIEEYSSSNSSKVFNSYLSVFKEAVSEAFEQITKTDIFEQITKTEDFRSFILEHNDAF